MLAASWYYADPLAPDFGMAIPEMRCRRRRGTDTIRAKAKARAGRSGVWFTNFDMQRDHARWSALDAEELATEEEDE